MSTEPLASAPEPSEQATMAHVVPSPTGATRSPSECLPCVGSAGTVPGYELLGELGRGGMGVVYRARQVKANRLVALKMILAGGHAGAAELARFRTEAEAIARLQHPNIVQVHEVGEHEGKPFFSLEFCGGGSLAQKLNGTPLPAREAAELVEALARAMQAAHARGVIHRDLKPANVLLAEDGTPKVTDFGLAKKLDEAGQTQSGAVLGTPSYMAPEQAAGKGKEIGPLADVYALGAILYECLTGRPPFRAATALDTILQVVNDEPVPPSQLQSKTPRDLETVCLKCLRKEPAKRYASAADLAEDLRRWQAGEPITARPVGRVERGVKWVRRNPVVTSLLAAVVLAVAGGGAGVYWKYLDAKEQAENARKQTAIAEGKTRELEDTLAEGWLLHVGYEETPTPAELAALRQLAETPNERVRLLFLEKALERPESAVRLRRRAELAAHAVVGLDRDREGRVVELLRAKLRDNAADAEVRVACVHFGLALQTKDEVFRGELVKAAAELLEPNGDPEALLALAVALGTLAERERLPPDQAAEAARYALGFLTVSTDFLLQCAAAQVTMDLARHLGLEQAAAVGPLVLDALAHTEDPLVRGLLAQAVAKVAERMGPGPGAELSARAVPHLLATPADAHNAPVPREEALTDLARQLGPEQAAALAQQVLSAMKKAKPDALVFLALALSKLADRPEPTQAAELSAAAAPLVFDARAKVRDPRVKASLARALEDLAERLGPERAAPFAQAVLAAMTQPADAADLGPVLAVLAGRLGPERAAELLAQAAPLVFDALAKPDNAGFRDSLIRAAKKLARRMEPGQAAKAARQTLDTVGKGADPALYATAAPGNAGRTPGAGSGRPVRAGGPRSPGRRSPRCRLSPGAGAGEAGPTGRTRPGRRDCPGGPRRHDPARRSAGRGDPRAAGRGAGRAAAARPGGQFSGPSRIGRPRRAGQAGGGRGPR